MNIFVASLPFTLSEADLKESFEAYGPVDSVKIIMDKATGRSKGFGFVEMSNAEDAQRAIEGLNGATVGGRAIVVNENNGSQPQQRKSFGGGGGRPSFNRDGGGQRSFNRDSNGGGGYRGNNDRYGNSGGGGGYRSNDGGGYRSNDGGGYRGNNDRYNSNDRYNNGGQRSSGGYRRDFNNDSDE